LYLYQTQHPFAFDSPSLFLTQTLAQIGFAHYFPIQNIPTVIQLPVDYWQQIDNRIGSTRLN